MPLTKATPMKVFIDDFIKSDDPKFAGKSKKKRIEMATAAYYSKQNEQVELDEANFEIGKVFHQEFAGGQRAYFIPKVLQKNGKHSGVMFDEGGAGRGASKPKNGSTGNSSLWNKTPEEEIPVHVKKLLDEAIEELDELSTDTLLKYKDAATSPKKINRAVGDGPKHDVAQTGFKNASKGLERNRMHDLETHLNTTPEKAAAVHAKLKDELYTPYYKHNDVNHRAKATEIYSKMYGESIEENVVDRDPIELKIRNKFNELSDTKALHGISITHNNTTHNFVVKGGKTPSEIGKKEGKETPIYLSKLTVGRTLPGAKPSLLRFDYKVSGENEFEPKGSPTNATDSDKKEWEAAGHKLPNLPKLLSKNESLDEEIIEEITNFMESEEYVNLDEISKIALSSYINEKHTEQEADHVKNIINTIKDVDQPTKEKHLAYLKGIMNSEDYNHIEKLLKTESIEEAMNWVLSKTPNSEAAYLTQLHKDAKEESKKPSRKGAPVHVVRNKDRSYSMSDEKNDLTLASYKNGEEIKEEVEEVLDEISKAAIGNYIKGAVDDIEKNSGSIPKYQHKNSANAANDITLKRHAGIETAVDKLAEVIPAKNKPSDEEIKLATAKSNVSKYIRSAAKDVDMSAYKASGKGTTDDEFADADAKIDKRKGGIEKAIGKLTKEEVEEIDEISQETTKRYVDKVLSPSELKKLENEMPEKKEKRMAGAEKACDKLNKEEVDEEVVDESIGPPIKSKTLKNTRVAKDAAGTEFVRNYIKNNLQTVSLKTKTKMESFFDAIESNSLSAAKEVLESIFAEKVAERLVELKEEVAKRRGSGEGVYHDTYRSALERAYKTANDRGFDVHEDDQDTNHVDPRPHGDETKKLHFRLLKDGKEHKQQLHVQVYNRGGDEGRPNSSPYELNHYIS